MTQEIFKEVVPTVTRLCMESSERERIQYSSMTDGLRNLEGSNAIN